MGSGGGGGSCCNTTSVNTSRFAPYIEARHQSMLEATFAERSKVFNSSPYAGYKETDVDAAFIGIGYAVSDFASLYDMFGSHLSGMDIEQVFDKAFTDVFTGSTINDKVKATANLDDDKGVLNTTALISLSMRDANAVHSSTFMIAKSNAEAQRLRDIAKLSSEIRFSLLDTAWNRFLGQLNWKKFIVEQYAFIFKLYYTEAMTMKELNTGFKSKNTLWPFAVLGYEQKNFSALAQTPLARVAANPILRERSPISKMLLAASYALTGAQIGSAIPGIGTTIGAVFGGVIGLAAVLFE